MTGEARRDLWAECTADSWKGRIVGAWGEVLNLRGGSLYAAEEPRREIIAASAAYHASRVYGVTDESAGSYASFNQHHPRRLLRRLGSLG